MNNPSFLLMVSSPKEEEMLQQALLQHWPHAQIMAYTNSLSAQPHLVIAWKNAFKNVLPEVLNQNNVLAVFEASDDPNRSEAFRLGLSELVLPAENRSAFLCMTCEKILKSLQSEKEQKQKWDKVVKNSTDAIYLITNGQLVDVNPRFETLFGYSREEALSSDFSIIKNIVAPESRSFIENRLKRIRRDQKVDTQYEFVATKKNAETFFAEVSIRYVDEQYGKSALGIVKDVTAQKDFEKKLVQKNNELQRLSERQQKTLRQLTAIDEFAKTIVSYREKKPLFEYVARQLRKLFAPDRLVLGLYEHHDSNFHIQFGLEGEMPQEYPNAIPRSETLMGTSMELQRALQRHLPTSATLQAPPLPPLESSWTKEGMQSFIAVPLLKRRSPIGGFLLAFGEHTLLSDDDLEALMSLANHLALGISNVELYHKKRDLEQQINEMRNQQGRAAHLIQAGEIAAGVAHDMNNLFSAILGRTTLIRKRQGDEDIDGHLEIVDKAVSDGIRTLKRLQGFSSEDSDSSIETVTPSQILEEVVAITRPKWSRLLTDQMQPPIEVLIEDETEDNLEINVYGHEIREVLINLIYNAVDAMPDGGQLTLRAQPFSDGKISFRVQDNGYGIPPPTLEKIFDRFFTTKGARGSGLGLSTSKDIVEEHGGTLEVTSSVEPQNHGTSFTVSLPVESSTHKKTTSQPTNIQRILIVDDESNVREILEDILSTEGHEVHSSASGEEALMLLQKHTFNLVFTDLSLPQMDGYSLAEAIKTQWPQTSICLITGWDNPLIAEKSVQNKVDRMINKPFHMDDVLQAVNELTS